MTSEAEITEALFDTTSGHLVDLVKGERTVYGGCNVGGVLEGNPHIERMQFDEAVRRAEKHARTRYSAGEAQRVGRDRFWDMLEVLPPCKWRRHHVGGRVFEVFHVSERLSGNLVTWFVADRTSGHEDLARYWEVVEEASIPLDNLLACLEATKGEAS